jgi:hypothetical protein
MDYANDTNFNFKRNVNYNIDDLSRFTKDIVEIQHCFIDETNPVGTSFRILRNIEKIKESLTVTKYNKIEFNDKMMFCMSVLPTTIIVAKYYNLNTKKKQALKQFLLESFDNNYQISATNKNVYEFKSDEQTIELNKLKTDETKTNETNETKVINAYDSKPRVTITDGVDSDDDGVDTRSWEGLKTLFDTPKNSDYIEKAKWEEIPDMDDIYDFC